MTKRNYHQFCAIAHALDIIGERWTLLIVRELLMGPKRFTDLLGNLPGIGTNLLAARLKELEEQRIIERSLLPPPAASSVYMLTELGCELRSVIDELWRWGSKTMQGPREGDHFRPGWSVLAMQYVFNPDEADGVNETYEFRIGEDVFHARIEDRTIATAQGHASNPDLVIITDEDTCFELASGKLSLTDAADTGRVQFEGSSEALMRCAKMFNIAATSGEIQTG